MIVYLSGVERAETRQAAAAGAALGILAQPGNTVDRQAGLYRWWAADNACFAKGATFDNEQYLTWLASLGFRATCLWATAPDVVADAAATLERSGPMLPRIRALGYPAALVAQDGLEALSVPWDTFDVLFLGGSTEWKLSLHAERLTAEAVRRGKKVHMGRVNSRKRLRLAASWGCHTADGTYLKFGPDKLLPKLLSWLTDVNGNRQMSLPMGA